MTMIRPMVLGMVDRMIKPMTGLPADQPDADAALGECFPLTGTLNGTNGTTVSLTRATPKIYQNNYGQYIEAAIDEQAAPALGGGTLLQGEVENKQENFNIAPDSSLTNLNDNANCTTTRVHIDDVEEPYQSQIRKLFPNIESAPWNGYIFKSEGAASGTPTCTITGAVGNTNVHTGQIFAVRVGGTSVPAYRVTAQAGDNVPITEDGFQELSFSFTPNDAARTLQVRTTNDGYVYWLANGLYERETAPYSIVEVQGAAATQAVDDCSVSTTGMPVNDCAYYIELPRGIRDNGANQVIWESQVDTSNWFRLIYVDSAGELRAQRQIGGLFRNASIALPDDGTPTDVLITMSSVDGMDIALSIGGTSTPATETADIPLSSTMQLGAVESLSIPLFGEIANFKYFNTSDITLKAAKYAC